MNPTVPNEETYDQDLADIAPCERWAHNVLNKAGFAKLRELTDEIKDSVREKHVNLGGDLEQKKKRRIA